MFTRDDEFRRGFAELRLALWHALDPRPALSPAFASALAGSPALGTASPNTAGGSTRLLSEAVDYDPRVTPAGGSDGPGHGSRASADQSRSDAAPGWRVRLSSSLYSSSFSCPVTKVKLELKSRCVTGMPA